MRIWARLLRNRKVVTRVLSLWTFLVAYVANRRSEAACARKYDKCGLLDPLEDHPRHVDVFDDDLNATFSMFLKVAHP